VVAGAPIASPSEGKGVNSLWQNLLDRVARAQALACGPAHPQPSHPARGTLGGAVELVGIFFCWSRNDRFWRWDCYSFQLIF
jgi:hypothetical protein